MPRRPALQPTEVELEILHVLWERGPCPLGQIHQEIAVRHERAYSTTRKMVQVMHAKGLIHRDDTARPQLYDSVESKEQTQLNLLEDIAARAFGGSTKKLVMSLLSAERVSAKELAEMQRLVKKAKGKKK